MISKSEISRILGVSRPTVYSWEEKGTLEEECKKRGLNLETGEVKESPLSKLATDLKEVLDEAIPTPAPEACATEAKESLIESKESVRKSMKRLAEFFPEILEKENKPVEFISTGFKELDDILGGGLVKGRLVEIFGVESAGKTTLSTQIAANWLKQGKKIAYLDFEHAMDIRYAESLGLHFDHIRFFQPDVMEDGMEIIRKLLELDEVDLIVVDSVASMTTKPEMEGEFGQATIGLKARYMSQLVRLITPDCDNKGITVIFINQIRKNIGMYVPPETTPGGLALRYGCTQRIELRLASAKDKSEGREVNITCVKNKVSDPYGKVTMNLEYGKGFQN